MHTQARQAHPIPLSVCTRSEACVMCKESLVGLLAHCCTKHSVFILDPNALKKRKPRVRLFAQRTSTQGKLSHRHRRQSMGRAERAGETHRGFTFTI